MAKKVETVKVTPTRPVKSEKISDQNFLYKVRDEIRKSMDVQSVPSQIIYITNGVHRSEAHMSLHNAMCAMKLQLLDRCKGDKDYIAQVLDLKAEPYTMEHGDVTEWLINLPDVDSEDVRFILAMPLFQ